MVENRYDDFDFVIWSGLPEDLERMTPLAFNEYNSHIFDEYFRPLFAKSSTVHIASSLVNMETTTRARPAQLFETNFNTSPLDNNIISDIDTHALVNVSS